MSGVKDHVYCYHMVTFNEIIPTVTVINRKDDLEVHEKLKLLLVKVFNFSPRYILEEKRFIGSIVK